MTAKILGKIQGDHQLKCIFMEARRAKWLHAAFAACRVATKNEGWVR